MAKAAEPGPRILLSRCDHRCSLNVQNIGEGRALMLHRWIEEGKSQSFIVRSMGESGVKTNQGSVSRHVQNHTSTEVETQERADFGALTELEALDEAIKQGQKSIPNWRMTPSEWMKAMELKLKLTQGTVFDGMLAAMAAAGMDDDGDDGPEDLEEDGEGPGSIRYPLSDQPATSGSSQLAPWGTGIRERSGSGEPVGEDLRDSDESYPPQRIQEGAEGTDTEGMA